MTSELKTKIQTYKQNHPEDGCKKDCLHCIEYNQKLYCLNHQDRFDSVDDMICSSYILDKIKILQVPTKEIRKIDKMVEENEKEFKANQHEQQEIEKRLFAHSKNCSRFKEILDYFYQSFSPHEGHVICGKQIIRNDFHYCPCCGHEIEDNEN